MVRGRRMRWGSFAAGHRRKGMFLLHTHSNSTSRTLSSFARLQLSWKEFQWGSAFPCVLSYLHLRTKTRHLPTLTSQAPSHPSQPDVSVLKDLTREDFLLRFKVLLFKPCVEMTPHETRQHWRAATGVLCALLGSHVPARTPGGAGRQGYLRVGRPGIVRRRHPPFVHPVTNGTGFGQGTALSRHSPTTVPLGIP